MRVLQNTTGGLPDSAIRCFNTAAENHGKGTHGAGPDPIRTIQKDVSAEK